MPDYSKTIIYKLINYDYPELVYVGSTTNFTKRKQQHKYSCHNEKTKGYNYNIYVNIRKNGGWENWNMIKICDYPCDNKREAEQEEDKYMVELKATINSRRAFRTRQEYYKDNKYILIEKTKKYREDKKGHYRDYHKQYREENKEKLQDKKKEYYKDNKELITQKIKEKVKCVCGCEILKRILKQHEKTKKHINLINKIKN